MKRTGEAQRCLQPVVELRKEVSSYAYSVRAPRSRGVIPPSSYRNGGFAHFRRASETPFNLIFEARP